MQPKGEQEEVGITREEVETLFAVCLDRGNFDRAAMWAGLLLEPNDPPIEANADA